MRTFSKLTSLKLASVSMIASLALCGTAMAQTATDRVFSAESVGFATEAQALQGQNEHKSAVKRLKKGLKLKGLTAYETSTMNQMLGASYYAQGKNDKAIEAFDRAILAGGLTLADKRNLQANVAQLNIVEENYQLGAQQLESYFSEGGQQSSKRVKLIVQAYMRSKNRAAAVPWAEVMLRQGYLDTRREHDVAVYLFDSPEKRSSQMQVARSLVAKWPNDPDVVAQVTRLNAKAKIDGVPTVYVAGQ